MRKLPTTLVEIQQYVSDKVQENIHLDYKGSGAIDPGKKVEIAKDISSFANSDGGLIIYGVEEDKDHFPLWIDGGIDHSTFSHERLEQIIQSNITPIIDDLIIQPIPLSPSRSVYVVQIPKSYRGPHQSADKKYYKRYNFLAAAMEDYEINDVRNRRQMVLPLINIDVIIKQGTAAFFVITNIGTLPARDVTFSFSEPLTWHEGRNPPAIFVRGAKYFPPGRTYYAFYNALRPLLNDVYPSKFEITVSYIHPQNNERITDVFPIDFKDYENSTVVESEFYEQTQTVKNSIDTLTTAVKEVSGHVDHLSNIAGATGLDLSFPTLRNLTHLATKDGQIEKIDPYGCSRRVFQEILGVDYVVAVHLTSFFRHGPDPTKKLRDVQGVTDELMNKIHTHFILPNDV